MFIRYISINMLIYLQTERLGYPTSRIRFLKSGIHIYPQLCPYSEIAHLSNLEMHNTLYIYYKSILIHNLPVNIHDFLPLPLVKPHVWPKNTWQLWVYKQNWSLQLAMAQGLGLPNLAQCYWVATSNLRKIALWKINKPGCHRISLQVEQSVFNILD